MAITITLNNISSGFNLSKINENFQTIETALLQALSRSSDTPNEMNVNLDMNGFDIINIGSIGLDGDFTLADYVSFAKEWANKAEDSLVSTDAGGDGVDDFSALHHANKASASATLADSAKTAAEAALDSFDDRYLGVKSATPTLDNDGDALVAGALYFDDGTTNTEGMYVYNGTAWSLISAADALRAPNNLSDVSSASASRTNLGLGTAAVENTGTGSGDVPLIGTKSATTTLAGLVEKSTSAENIAGTDDTVFPSVAGTKEMIDTHATFDPGTTLELLHIQDQKTSGTDAQGLTGSTWVTRDLNTVVTNEITGASLSSNQVTLPSGTYWIEATAPATLVNGNRLRLRNTSDSTTDLLGQSSNSTASNTNNIIATMTGQIVIASSKTFEIQHWAAVTNATNGGGDAVGSGDAEIYTDLAIWKIS